MISRTKITLLTGAAALVTAAAGTGVAFGHSAYQPTAYQPTAYQPTAAPATATLAAFASTAPESPGMSHWPGRHCGHGGMLGRIEHGEATLRAAHGQEVVDFQRGTVESVSPGQLSVRSADGFGASYVVNDSTKIRKNGWPIDNIRQVMTNDRVIVLATKSGGTATATRIADTGQASTNH